MQEQIESKSGRWTGLALILLLAALMRLVGAAPPGIHVDEASNAWNAWCLWNVGIDEHGRSYPIFYTGAFGDNRSPLFLYFLMPFQALFGFGAYTTRLPAVCAGIGSVALIYFVGRRLFDDARVGLAAAFLMALTPWQVFSSRWGHESSLSPLLVLGSVAALLWAGAPFTRRVRPMSPVRGLFAGLVCGFACYGYAAVRIALPVLLVGLMLVSLRYWIAALRDPNRRAGVVTIALGFCIAFAPLVYVHLTVPEINARGNLTWVWNPDDALATRVAKVAARYPAHFGPNYLFLDHNDDPTQSMPTGFGVLHWYALPLLLIGVAAIAWRARSSPAARWLIVALLAYPAGDLLNKHEGPNTLRSLAGLPWLELAGGVGAVAAFAYVRPRWRPVAVGALSLVGVGAGTLFLVQLDRDFRTDEVRWHVRTMDLQAAAEWLRPRLEACDAVFWTQRDMSFVYAPVMVYLDQSPQAWKSMVLVRARSTGDDFPGANLVWQTGKHHYLFTYEFADATMRSLRANGHKPRIAYIVRPGEILLDPRIKPSAEVRGPDGQVKLQLFDVQY